MTITDQQQKLFSDLRQHTPEIIADGVPDEAQYTSAPCRIMYVLKEVNGGSGWSRRERILPKICAVNVKKTSGSYVSDSREIYESAIDNADILKKQLELYAPDLVICCGTEDAFVNACFRDKEIDWRMTSRGIWYFRDNDMMVISFSHPAAQVRDCYLYYALLDAVREIKSDDM